MIIDRIKEIVKDSDFKGFAGLEKHLFGERTGNLARTLQTNIEKINRFLEPLGYELTLKKKN